MKHLFARLAALVLLLSGSIVFVTAGPAQALVDHGTYAYRDDDDGRVRGQAHIHQIAGNQYDIAVSDQVADGVNVCVLILATNGDDTYYCDTTGAADGVAKHYSIWYDWSFAWVCRGQSLCNDYVDRL